MDKEKSSRRKFDENVKKCFKWAIRLNLDTYQTKTALNHLKWLLEKAWNEMLDDGELVSRKEISQQEELNWEEQQNNE